MEEQPVNANIDEEEDSWTDDPKEEAVINVYLLNLLNGENEDGKTGCFELTKEFYAEYGRLLIYLLNCGKIQGKNPLEKLCFANQHVDLTFDREKQCLALEPVGDLTIIVEHVRRLHEDVKFFVENPGREIPDDLD